MSFNDTWPDADPDAVNQTNDTEPPADGTYDVLLAGAEAFTSKAGADWVKLALQLVDGTHPWTVLLGFKSPMQANISKGQVRTVGVDVDSITSLDALDAALTPFVGNYYRVNVKTNGTFRNTFLEGPIGAQDVPASAVTVNTDDVPF